MRCEKIVFVGGRNQTQNLYVSPTDRANHQRLIQALFSSHCRYADQAKNLKKPPIPEHLLAQAEASSKKRRLGPLLGPTPAKKKVNSTFDNGTPTPRKFGAKPRLNSTTPVGVGPPPPSYLTSTLNRSRVPTIDESDDDLDRTSVSDISSIAGPSTSSSISSVSRPTVAANNSIMFDSSMLSPIVKKIAEKVENFLFFIFVGLLVHGRYLGNSRIVFVEQNVASIN